MSRHLLDEVNIRDQRTRLWVAARGRKTKVHGPAPQTKICKRDFLLPHRAVHEFQANNAGCDAAAELLRLG